jgi:hypothetical protein
MSSLVSDQSLKQSSIRTNSLQVRVDTTNKERALITTSMTSRSAIATPFLMSSTSKPLSSGKLESNSCIRIENMVKFDHPTHTPVVSLINQNPLPEAAAPRLTAQERVRLGQLELEIEQNLTGFIRCGRALLEVRESRLYRERYKTFADYCRERFALARSTADQICRSTQVFESLVDSGLLIPENVPELTLRPISQLPGGDLQTQAWRLSAKVAPEGKAPTHTVTAKVSRMIREVTEGTNKRTIPARELMFTRPISQLAKIDSFDVNVCLLHVKTSEQAKNISHACGVVADRCRAIQAKLGERFPDAC